MPATYLDTISSKSGLEARDVPDSDTAKSGQPSTPTGGDDDFSTIHLATRVDQKIAAIVEDGIGSQSFIVDQDASEMGRIGACALEAVLSAHERKMLSAFGAGFSTPLITITGLPTVLPTPDTFQGHGDDSLVRLADVVHLGIYNLMGLCPISYSFENDGRLFRNIAPTGVSGTSQSADELRWHVDNPYRFEWMQGSRAPAPYVLGFTGLRNRDGKGAPVPTELLRVDTVVEDGTSPSAQ